MMKTAAGFSALILAATLGGVSAYAVDVDVDIRTGDSRPRTVVVQPPPTVHRVWVPDRVERQTERVLISPARIEKRGEKICVQPAHTRTVDERVLVQPARIERIQESVMVKPPTHGREYVPAVTERVKLGPVNITRTIREGYYRDVSIPAEYRQVYREVEVPAKYENVRREYTVPARYETVYKEIEIPAQYREVTRDVVIPGHWEEHTHSSPPEVIVDRPRRSGIDIDIDFSKKKKHKHDD
jgi:hypothetical protein